MRDASTAAMSTNRVADDADSPDPRSFDADATPRRACPRSGATGRYLAAVVPGMSTHDLPVLRCHLMLMAGVGRALQVAEVTVSRPPTFAVPVTVGATVTTGCPSGVTDAVAASGVAPDADAMRADTTYGAPTSSPGTLARPADNGAVAVAPPGLATTVTTGSRHGHVPSGIHATSAARDAADTVMATGDVTQSQAQSRAAATRE